MLVLGIIILISAMRKWKELLSKSPAQRRAAATETVAEQLS
jgi:carbon starvation protein